MTVEELTSVNAEASSLVSLLMKLIVTVPPETANGKVFRLRSLGMPNLKNPQERGNLYVTVQVQLPRDLSQQERELFQKLRELRK